MLPERSSIVSASLSAVTESSMSCICLGTLASEVSNAVTGNGCPFGFPLAESKWIPHTLNTPPRFLLVEAAQVTVRSQAQWRSKYFHLAMLE
jgi:hypothetical protein